MNTPLVKHDATVHGESGTGPFLPENAVLENGAPAENVALPPSSPVVRAVCISLLLAVALVFGQTIRHGFINFDDDRFVYENPQVTSGLTAHGIVWALTDHGFQWRPLTWVSHMIDWQFYGPHAGGHHATNVLLHAATTVLLFLLFWRMTGRVWPSALVAILFAIHPLRIESVAWVTERKDVLSGLFFVLTLGAYVDYVRQPFSVERYLTVVVFFTLGLLSKSMLVTLPLLLLLLDYWPLGRLSDRSGLDLPPLFCGERAGLGGTGFWAAARGRFLFPRRLLLEKLPLFALVAASCAMTVWSHTKAVAPIDRVPVPWRLGNALVTYVVYLRQFFYPAHLAVLYPTADLDLPLWKVCGAALILATVTAAAWIARRKYPYFLFGWLWYVGMLVPVIGLLQFGVFTHANRFTYLPQIGVYVALAWGAADVCRSWSYRRSVCGIASALTLTVLIGCAWRQASFWRDSETLWTHALACTSQNKLAHNNLGNFLADQERLAEAIAHYQQALTIDPNYIDAHFNLGAALFSQGRYDEAIAQYRQALKIQPDFVLAHNNLGETLAHQGHLDEAIAHYRKALEIQSDCILALNNLGQVLARRGRPEEAIAQYHKALKIQPDYLETLKNLAWLLATCPEAVLRNGRAAQQLADRANRLCAGSRADVLDTLAAACAEMGRFPDAVAAAQKALELATQANDRALTDALRARIALYQADKPYHQTLGASQSSY
jgi:tetratricopeptide (TPR) repeat protein